MPDGRKNICSQLVETTRWLLKHGLAELMPAARRAREQWLKKDGVEFAKKIGIKPGNTVVDFGCGSGAYTIPAALAVSEKGLVVAVDMQAQALRRLMRRAATAGLANVKTARSAAELPALLAGRRCNAILLYDVLHFMDQEARQKLYTLFRGMLAPDGMLSVHPKHTKDDARPARHFLEMTAEDVAREIENAGFALKEKKNIELWHDLGTTKGEIFTFEPAGRKT